MNRYVAQGILADVVAGRRVLYVGQTWHGARHAFEELVEHWHGAGVPFARVVRANGQERIEHEGGGRVLFTSHLGHGGRGVEVDVVFVDAEIGVDRLAELMPCVAASPHGEVMRA